MNDKVVTSAFLTSLLLLILCGLVFMGWATQERALGSAPSGNPATVATTSFSIVAAAGVNTLFGTSTVCTDRIITTQAGSGIMLTFSDYAGQSPSATLGHWQAPSTTVAYDSGLYGCGLTKAYSFGAQTLTVTETR